MRFPKFAFNSVVLACAVAASGAAVPPVLAGQGQGESRLQHQPAVRSTAAMHAGILAIARAGSRIVAVGDRGAVLLSDDEGGTFRQAAGVPTRVTLTGAAFAPDGKTGWAVGHWGVVLRTTDGGEHWEIQRDDRTVDQPLFSVTFADDRNGIAVGLWSLMARTEDGGKTWRSSVLSDGGAGAATEKKAAGRNLFSLVTSATGTLLAAAEQGVVYRSRDFGASWTAIPTGNKGTFWVGQSLRSGAVLVAGLGGKIYRSADDGLSWSQSESHTNSSLTAMAQAADGTVTAVGLDGVVLTSRDDGRTFQATNLADRSTLTAVIVNKSGKRVVFSDHGLVSLPGPSER